MVKVAELDLGIKHPVMLLRSWGIETWESCDGRPGHAYSVPTICCFGDENEVLRAKVLLESHGYKVSKVEPRNQLIEGFQITLCN